MENRKGLCIVIILLLMFTFQNLEAQFLTTPQASPKAAVMQRIGLTDVKILYHRPGVKERVIWGDLVPFDGGDPRPWRAGANENTVIAFSHDVKVNGNELPAGKYGFHIIPSENDWIIIFNKNSTSFGSYFYKPEEDALRVTVTPVEAPFQERLAYGFDELTENSANAFLHWEKLKASFTIEVDVHNTTIASLEEELRGGYGFFWYGYNNAAAYCLNADTHLDLGLVWVNQSIQMDKNYRNLATKGMLLSKKGQKDEAIAVLEEAKEIAPENWKKRIQQWIENL